MPHHGIQTPQQADVAQGTLPNLKCGGRVHPPDSRPRPWRQLVNRIPFHQAVSHQSAPLIGLIVAAHGGVAVSSDRITGATPASNLGVRYTPRCCMAPLYLKRPLKLRKDVWHEQGTVNRGRRGYLLSLQQPTRT